MAVRKGISQPRPSETYRWFKREEQKKNKKIMKKRRKLSAKA